MELGVTLLGVSLILINILLIILIRTYQNTLTYIKKSLGDIYNNGFQEKISYLVINIDKIKYSFKELIDYQKTIVQIDKAIFESLNENINDKNKKVDKSKSDIEYLKDISFNICLIKESLLNFSNDIYNYIILPAKQKKEIEDFNAKPQGTI